MCDATEDCTCTERVERNETLKAHGDIALVELRCAGCDALLTEMER